MFLLMRVQGLRRCELLALKQTDVDWSRNVICIHSPKTGYRECPYLLTALKSAPEVTLRLIHGYVPSIAFYPLN